MSTRLGKAGQYRVNVLGMNSQQKIMDAFRGLVLNQPYDAFSVQTIVQHAGVGRSTFYVHFRDKDDLLLKSLQPILKTLAELIDHRETPSDTRFVFEHIWENRQLGRVFFCAPLVSRLGRALAEEIDRPNTASLYRLHGILGVLGLWCEGRINLTPHELADFFASESAL